MKTLCHSQGVGTLNIVFTHIFRKQESKAKIKMLIFYTRECQINGGGRKKGKSSMRSIIPKIVTLI